MLPKEKAEELYWKYYHNVEHYLLQKDEHEVVKQCALICCDEVLGYMGADRGYEFWTEVKEELLKM